ncbi:MAG: hypothetical protein AABZ12_06680 [Planctomycetota bacterium]
MRVDDLRHLHRTTPFRPFRARVADGREYLVAHPEFMSVSVSGRTVVISTPDDMHEVIDTMLISSVHFENGKTRRLRRS